jgi:hypothetical protein
MFVGFLLLKLIQSLVFAYKLHLSCRLAQTDISEDSPEVWKLDNAKERNLTTLAQLGETLLGQYATTVNFETGNLRPSTVLNSKALHR